MVSVYKCPSCKSKIEYECNYCQHCGAKLEWDDDESAENSSIPSEDELVFAYGLNDCVPNSDSMNSTVMASGAGIGGLFATMFAVGLHNFLYARCSEIKLCHSKNRLYGIAPDNKNEEINVSLNDVSVEYAPVVNSDFGSIIIKIPSKAKTYTYPNVYMPNRFYESIIAALSGKFDKSIYQSGLRNLPQKSDTNETNEEPDEFDDTDNSNDF